MTTKKKSGKTLECIACGGKNFLHKCTDTRAKEKLKPGVLIITPDMVDSNMDDDADDAEEEEEEETAEARKLTNLFFS